MRISSRGCGARPGGRCQAPALRWLGLLVAAALMPAAAFSQQAGTRSGVPPNGFVPDSATAVRIAVAVWTPIYGEKDVRSAQPYIAILEGGVWTVQGTLGPCETSGSRDCVVTGGVALARIAREDGRILLVTHGQ